MEIARQQDINQRQQQFIGLYKNVFPSFARFVSRMGGDLNEAKDTFQDALLAWYEKTVLTNINITKSDEAYVLGIAKFLWIRRYKNMVKDTVLSATIYVDELLEEQASPSEEKLLKILGKVGHKCMELLRSFYYDKLSPAKIAERYSFSGERSATVQKYKCLEKVRNEVKRKSLSYADFID